MKRGMTTMTCGDSRRTTMMKRCRSTVIGLAALAMAGCINVTAPEKPIEIVLTINIRQEIVVRLDSAAKELIESNTEIF